MNARFEKSRRSKKEGRAPRPARTLILTPALNTFLRLLTFLFARFLSHDYYASLRHCAGESLDSPLEPDFSPLGYSMAEVPSASLVQNP